MRLLIKNEQGDVPFVVEYDGSLRIAFKHIRYSSRANCTGDESESPHRGKYCRIWISVLNLCGSEPHVRMHLIGE